MLNAIQAMQQTQRKLERLAAQYAAERNAKSRSKEYMLQHAPVAQLASCQKAERMGWGFCRYVLHSTGTIGNAAYVDTKTRRVMYVYADGTFSKRSVK